MRVQFSGQPPSLEAPIHDHAQYLIGQIYHKPYPGDKGASSAGASSAPPIARTIHGAQHVCRAALLIPVLVNVYRHFMPGSVDNLTPEHIKLLQIAALLHDSGREDEAYDFWDIDSAENCFDYLVHHLKLSADTALKFCSAIANKDYEKRILKPEYQDKIQLLSHKNRELFYDEITPYYHRFSVSETGDLVIRREDYDSQERTIHDMLLHDVDCLDIIRVVRVFDPIFLDLFESCCTDEREIHDQEKFDCFIRLIAEVRSMIQKQGDAQTKYNLAIKQEYEHADNCYIKTLSDISPENYPILSSFYHGEFTALTELCARYDALKDRELPLLNQQLRKGLLACRGIGIPMLQSKNSPNNHIDEELHHLFEQGINPDRSMFIPGWGTTAFSRTGFITEIANERLHSIATKDACTGYDSKGSLFSPVMTEAQKITALEYAITQVQLGGDGVNYEGSSHNELNFSYRPQDIRGIYYITEDSPSFYCTNPELSKIEAHHIQEACRSRGLALPVYRYSHAENMLHEENITKESIISAWKDIFLQQFKREIKKYQRGKKNHEHILNSNLLCSSFHQFLQFYYNITDEHKALLSSIDRIPFYDEVLHLFNHDTDINQEKKLLQTIIIDICVSCFDTMNDSSYRCVNFGDPVGSYTLLKSFYSTTSIDEKNKMKIQAALTQHLDALGPIESLMNVDNQFTKSTWSIVDFHETTLPPRAFLRIIEFLDLTLLLKGEVSPHVIEQLTQAGTLHLLNLESAFNIKIQRPLFERYHNYVKFLYALAKTTDHPAVHDFIRQQKSILPSRMPSDRIIEILASNHLGDLSLLSKESLSLIQFMGFDLICVVKKILDIKTSSAQYSDYLFLLSYLDKCDPLITFYYEKMLAELIAHPGRESRKELTFDIITLLSQKDIFDHQQLAQLFEYYFSKIFSSVLPGNKIALVWPLLTSTTNPTLLMTIARHLLDTMSPNPQRYYSGTHLNLHKTKTIAEVYARVFPCLPNEIKKLFKRVLETDFEANNTPLYKKISVAAPHQKERFIETIEGYGLYFDKLLNTPRHEHQQRFNPVLDEMQRFFNNKKKPAEDRDIIFSGAAEAGPSGVGCAL